MNQQGKTYLFLYQECQEDAFSLLPRPIQEHIQECHTYEHTKKRSASNYFHLEEVLKNHFHRSLDELYFVQQKPYIDGLYLSLSHSNQGYGFAISTSQNVGFDMEEIRTFDHQEVFAKRILTKKEKEQYDQSPSQNVFLLQCWCKKEAYGKMIGKGINKRVLKVEIPHYEIGIWHDMLYAVVFETKKEPVQYFFEDIQKEEESTEI